MAKTSGNNKKQDVCSFCGRSKKQVDAFVEGPGGVFICPECIDLCYNIVRQERRRVSGSAILLDEVPKPPGGPQQHPHGTDGAHRPRESRNHLRAERAFRRAEHRRGDTSAGLHLRVVQGRGART